MNLYWHLGSYHTDGRITLVRAENSKEAVTAFREPWVATVHQCKTPVLEDMARGFRLYEVWTCKVDRLPGWRDRHRMDSLTATGAARRPRT